jgi:diadenosine tetraphosphate (Ap4A) HIT family hydrolase
MRPEPLELQDPPAELTGLIANLDIAETTPSDACQPVDALEVDVRGRHGGIMTVRARRLRAFSWLVTVRIVSDDTLGARLVGMWEDDLVDIRAVDRFARRDPHGWEAAKRQLEWSEHPTPLSLYNGDEPALATLVAKNRARTAELMELVEYYGWPTPALVGHVAIEAAHHLLMHADSENEWRERCLHLVADAVARADYPSDHLEQLSTRTRIVAALPAHLRRASETAPRSEGLGDVTRGVPGCPICMRATPLDVIAELDTVWVTASPDAVLPGYVCVVSKLHADEPFDLPGPQRAAFWDEAMRVARGLARALGPKKMNFEIHGNTIAHLHLHLFPRFAGDPFEGRPIDWREQQFHRTTHDLDTLAAAVVRN